MISTEFIQRIVNYSNRKVHAHNLCWRRILEKAFDKRNVFRLRRTIKSDFLPSFKFFRVDFETFGGNVVG